MIAKDEKFQIVILIQKLIRDEDLYLLNFPRKDMELKQNIKNTSLELLKLVYEANITGNAERQNMLQEKSLALVKFIDFLINLCYEKQIINSKKYIRFGGSLEKILRYILAWRKVKT